MTELRPRHVAALPRGTTTEQITDLLTSSYDAFCTCVVAEATRRVPPTLRRVLQRPAWREDWIDALLGAEGDLQVAVLRARHETGLDSRRTADNMSALAAVRARLHEVRAQAKQAKQHVVGDGATTDAPNVQWATSKLAHRYRVEYSQLIAEELSAAGFDPAARSAPRGDCTAHALWAITSRSPLLPTVTPRVRELQAMNEEMFRTVAALDVQRNPEEPELGHPLLLDRWEEALRSLTEITAALLGIPVRPMATVTDADMTTAGLDDEAVYARINQLRFLVHVRQRRLERRTRARRFQQDIALWREQVVGPATVTARERLRERYRAEYDELLASADRQAEGAPRPVDAPAETPAQPAGGNRTTPVPNALQVFGEQIEHLGWEIRIQQDPDGNQVRIDARRDRLTTLRVSYRRKNKGGGAMAWRLAYVGIWTAPIGQWLQLPSIGVVLDLAAMSGEEIAAQALRYRESVKEAGPKRLRGERKGPSSDGQPGATTDRASRLPER